MQRTTCCHRQRKSHSRNELVVECCCVNVSKKCRIGCAFQLGPGMVTEGALSQTSNLNSDGEDTISTASSDHDHDQNYDGTIVLHDDRQQLPSFGSIAVTNSSDVHFGNKTFYQGPVTIKQFLYANGKVPQDKTDCDSEIVLDAANIPDGLVNPGFIPEFPADNQAATNKSVTQENGTEVLKGFPRLQKFIQENIVILVILLALLIVSLGVLMTVLLLKHNSVPLKTYKVSVGDSDEQEKNTPIDSPIDPETNITLSKKLKLVSRLEWLAQPPIQPADPLPTPVPYVIIHHTATENCSSQAQCVFHVRYIQTFHIESRHWWDIGYNFLVGGDGEAYEGRGWTSVGAHSYGYNKRSIGIAFIGTFINSKPPQRQITACKRLIAKGLELGYIKKDYKLLAAKQLQATQSPGEALYEDMKTWDHWAKEP